MIEAVRRRAAVAAVLTTTVLTALLVGAPAAVADPIGSITGVVSTDGDAAAVSDVQVELWDSTGSLAQDPVQPAPNGDFTFSGLEPGNYTLHFPVEGAHNGWYVDQYYNGAPDAAHATVVTVPADSTDPVTLAPVELARAPSSPQPTIAGPDGTSSVAVGQYLTATVGHWYPQTNLTYQWYADGSPIAGATGLTHKVTAADWNKAITFAVTGSGSGDPVTETSAPVSPGPGSFDDVSAPFVAGPARIGSTLSVHGLGWQPTPSFRYEWLSNGRAVSGAPTYRVASTDGGHHLAVRVVGSSPGYTSVTLTSAAVAIPLGVFRAAPAPTISGKLVYGQTLKATPGTWAPRITPVYQWYRGSAAIGRATGSTYKLAVADIGKRLMVKVTGRSTGYVSKTVASKATGVVAALKLTPATPKITGKAAFGGAMKAVPGTWRPTAHLTYQWYNGSVAIARATGSSYAPGAALVGHLVHVVVTGTKTGYTTAHASSTGHKIAAAKFSSVPTPKISGSAKVGGVLTENVAARAPFAIQWRLGSKNIAGATKASYRVGSHDVGQRISVVVTAARAGYATVTHVSAGTAVVAGQTFANCTALKSVYPYGVARNGVTANMVSGSPRALVGPPFFSTYEYNLVIAHNSDLDRDKDHIACETS